jgi:hypothetical protein
MKPPPQSRSAGAPDRIYRPNAVAELNNERVPAGTSVNVQPIRSTLRGIASSSAAGSFSERARRRGRIGAFAVRQREARQPRLP